VSQIGAGSDVLYHASGLTGHGVFEAARDANVYAIGVDSDQYDEMPGTVVTSMVKGCDVAVFDTIRDFVDGRFRGGVRSFGLADNGVDYVSEGPHGDKLPAELKDRVATLRERVVRGEISVPTE
jgi:basic membrane protein A and related proteins